MTKQNKFDIIKHEVKDNKNRDNRCLNKTRNVSENHFSLELNMVDVELT